jgi:hypothetical protein
MALPTLSVPKYPIIIPSTKKKTRFRPFLVKEQKLLFMALESGDETHMIDAMCDIVSICVDGVDDPKKMPIFDLEYLFAKIRSKSVGETVTLKATCPECDAKQDVEINLENVEVEFPSEHNNKIMLSDDVGLILKYPALGDVKPEMKEMNSENIVNFICDSIDVVFDKETTYTRKDFTDDEIKQFVDSMNAAQFEKISGFYLNMPNLKKEIECKCKSCSHEFKIVYKGLRDFFI